MVKLLDAMYFKLNSSRWSCIKGCLVRNITTVGHQSRKEIKPFSSIPTVKSLPIFGSMFELLAAPYGVKNLHKFMEKRILDQGMIFKDRIYFKDIVFTSNPDDFEIVLKDEKRDKLTLTTTIWSLEAYNKKRCRPKQLLYADSIDEYVRLKGSREKALLTPREFGRSIPLYSKVTDDMITYLEHNIKESNSNVLNDFQKFISPWTFECSGVTLFRRRLGIFNEIQDKAVLQLYQAALAFFEALPELEIGSPLHRLINTNTWNSFVDANDNIYEACCQLIDRYGEFVIDKKIKDDLSEAEVISLCIGIITGSIHTTKQTALWALIQLSYNPDVQECIYEESKKIMEDDTEISYNILQKLSYTRGCLKEVFRTKPLVPILNRKIQSDLILSGYSVPAGTHVMLLTGIKNQQKSYKDSHLFKPERWLRKPEEPDCSYASTKNHPFGVLPFGYGMRMCPGRRIAENSLYVFLVKICQNFKITPISENVESSFELVLIPNEPVSLRLEKR